MCASGSKRLPAPSPPIAVAGPEIAVLLPSFFSSLSVNAVRLPLSAMCSPVPLASRILLPVTLTSAAATLGTTEEIRHAGATPSPAARPLSLIHI